MLIICFMPSISQDASSVLAMMLPVCCLIIDDIVFLWKHCNGAIDVHCNVYFPANTIFFEQVVSDSFFAQNSTNDKLLSEPHVLPANELIRLKVDSFDKSLLTLKHYLFKYLKSITGIFYKLNKSYSHFINCLCSFCRANVIHLRSL